MTYIGGERQRGKDTTWWTWVNGVAIKLLKVRHDVTKLDFIVP